MAPIENLGAFKKCNEIVGLRCGVSGIKLKDTIKLVSDHCVHLTETNTTQVIHQGQYRGNNPTTTPCHRLRNDGRMPTFATINI